MSKSFNCRRCQKSFTPAEHQWIFYELCNHCFNLFDNQKMTGRFGSLGMLAECKPIPLTWFESSEEWIKANPYREGEQPQENVIQHFLTAMQEAFKDKKPGEAVTTEELQEKLKKPKSEN
jgi:hypothetical protein